MELKEVIEKRRSIRRYTETEVADSIVEDLIDCARLAPSAKNRQPWQFVVVDKKTKNQIADMMLDDYDRTKDNLSKEMQEIRSSVVTSARVIKEAPTLIIVLVTKQGYWPIGDTLSIGAAIEHICLRAMDLGLGSLWIRDIAFTQKEIATLIGHEEQEVISAISIGYPNQAPKPRPRKELTEILEWR